MPSAIELVFSAVGTEAAARAVEGVSDKMAEMTRELGRLATAALTVDAAIEGVKGAIEDGAAFAHMATRIGESVQQTVVLSQAFKAAGLGSEYIGQSANLLQKALGGVNEMGGRTEVAFRRLGLSIQELKPLSYADQLQELSKGFAGIQNPADRAAIAMQLFGRSGGSMLQLLGDPRILEEAQEQAGRLGDRMAADAQKFHDVEVHLGVINLRLKEMWAAAAEQVLPALESVSKIVGDMNFSGAGAFIGGAGSELLAAGIAGTVFSQLKAATEKWAKTGSAMGSVFAKDFVMPLTETLANVLPVGIAAAITVSIIDGIEAAIMDGKIQRLLGRQSQIDSIVSPETKKLRGIGSQEDAAALLADVQKTIVETQKKIDDLEAKKTASVNAATANFEENYTGKVGTIPAPQKHPFTVNDANTLSALKTVVFDLNHTVAALQDPEAVSRLIAGHQLAELKSSLETSVANLPQLRAQNDKLNLETKDPAQQAEILRGRLAEAQRSQSAPLPAGLNADEAEAMTLSRNNAVLELKKELASVNAKLLEQAKQLGEESKRDAEKQNQRDIYGLETQMMVAKANGDAAGEQRLKEQIELKRASASASGIDLDIAKQRIAAEHQIWVEQQAQAAAKKQLEDQRVALENSLSAIRENLATLEADYTRTDAQKWADRKKAIAEEIATIQEEIKADQLKAKNARSVGDEVSAGLYDKDAAGHGKDVAGLQNETARLGPDPTSYAAQLSAATTNIAKTMGTVAQQVGQAWQSMGETMRSSLGTALYDMEERTKTFRQAAFEVYKSIAQSFVHSASEMAANWIMNHTIMEAADRILYGQSVAEHTGAETAKTASSAAGSASRTAIRIGETIVHGIQVAIQVAAHTAGELLKTAVTLIQSPIRLAATIAESFASVVQAAAEAMAAFAAIPVVGPALGIAAAAALLAAGYSMVEGAHREMGGPVQAGRSYIVGEKRAEVFTPTQDGYIHPDASTFSLPAGSRFQSQPGQLAGASGGGSMAGKSFAGSSMGTVPNVHIYLDKSSYLKAIRGDISGIAHEVYDKRERS